MIDRHMQDVVPGNRTYFIYLVPVREYYKSREEEFVYLVYMCAVCSHDRGKIVR